MALTNKMCEYQRLYYVHIYLIILAFGCLVLVSSLVVGVILHTYFQLNHPFFTLTGFEKVHKMVPAFSLGKGLYMSASDFCLLALIISVLSSFIAKYT